MNPARPQLTEILQNIWVWAFNLLSWRNPLWKVSLGGRPDGRPTTKIISNISCAFVKTWIGRPAGRARLMNWIGPGMNKAWKQTAHDKYPINTNIINGKCQISNSTFHTDVKIKGREKRLFTATEVRTQPMCYCVFSLCATWVYDKVENFLIFYRTRLSNWKVSVGLFFCLSCLLYL